MTGGKYELCLSKNELHTSAQCINQQCDRTSSFLTHCQNKNWFKNIQNKVICHWNMKLCRYRAPPSTYMFTCTLSCPALNSMTSRRQSYKKLWSWAKGMKFTSSSHFPRFSGLDFSRLALPGPSGRILRTHLKYMQHIVEHTKFCFVSRHQRYQESWGVFLKKIFLGEPRCGS